MLECFRTGPIVSPLGGSRMKPHLARVVLVVLVLLATTSGRQSDDRTQTHPFIVDLGPMGVVRWFRAIRINQAAFM
jgi:hypothetical protein